MSIADAIREVKTKIDKVYKVLEDAGATIPEDKNLDNLQLTIESKPGGETVMAYYVDTDIAEGKKVMMTRTTNQAVQDSEFCNGYIPYFINDGVAYCSTTSGSNYGYLSNVTVRQIVDGKVSNENSVNIGHSGDITGYQPFVQSCCGGKSVLVGWYNSSSYRYPKTSGLYTGSVYKSMNIGSEHTIITEHFYSWIDRSSSYRMRFANLPPVQVAGATLPVFNFSQTNAVYLGIAFERKADEGKAFYRLYSSAFDNWSRCFLEKYDLETNTITSMGEASVLIETTKTHYGNIAVQTKDYKYIIHCNGYIYLDVPVDGGGTGFAFREYPQQIKDAIGDRTIISLQAFYDKYFALMLSDGATLMCNYYNDYSVGDGDLMQVVDVEEIEPFKIPDDDTVYQRLYSGDRLFWFLSTINRKSPTADKNPAGQFDKENNTSSWFASEPSSVRFNSTVLTGFMTGESKTENGRQLVEVKTVTK